MYLVNACLINKWPEGSFSLSAQLQLTMFLFMPILVRIQTGKGPVTHSTTKKKITTARKENTNSVFQYIQVLHLWIHLAQSGMEVSNWHEEQLHCIFHLLSWPDLSFENSNNPDDYLWLQLSLTLPLSTSQGFLEYIYILMDGSWLAILE